MSTTYAEQEPLPFLLFVILYIILHCSGQTGATGCEDTSIGIEARGIIPDSSFTASSTYDRRYMPYFARIGDTRGNGWDQSNPQNDNNQYLQIDLGFDYFVCAIATKAGRSGGWGEYVKTYKITMSNDKQNWTPYKEDGREKVFNGNRDKNGIVKRSLKNKPLMRYIRLYPITYYSYKSIKIAIYGYAKFQVCITNPLGMQSGDIPDDRISASSSQQSTSNARLQSASSWCPASHDYSPFLQIDLGSDHVICAVATQGSKMADQWIKLYHIWTSSNESTLAVYKENNVTRMFYGNYDRSTIARQVIYHSPTARYVRIAPQTYHGASCLRIEIYGYQLKPVCSKHSVGVPSQLIVPNHRFAASSTYSSYSPSLARLQGGFSWWSSTQNNEYLQVDLGKIFRICAVLTQGAPSRSYWITNYAVQYSHDNRLWKTYEELGVEKVFQGNSDKSSIVTNFIKYSFKTKFIRVISKGFNKWIALRVDFKGVAEACTGSLGVENKGISDSQMTSSSSSGSSHAASRGRLYGSSSWCGATLSKTEYIQVDLGRVKTVTGVATQGDPSQNKWVTSYSLMFSFSRSVWYNYTEGQFRKVFIGNTNKNDVIVNWLHRPIAARYVRIIPLKNSGGNCMRLDLYGCAFVTSPKATIKDNEVTLPSNKGSSQALKCTVIGEPSPTIQWFRNGSEMIQSATLTVQFTSATDIISKYTCKRKDPNLRPVICKMNYTCRAMFPVNVPSAGPSEATTQVTVNLNVPGKQAFSVTPAKRSLRLTWSPVKSDDVGRITGFVLKLNNMVQPVHPDLSWFRFSPLEPYTNYTLQMKAFSVVGEGMWSDVKPAITLISEPEGTPSRLSATAKSSTSIEVAWALPDSARFNGPKTGFRITYKDAGGNKNTKEVDNIRRIVLSQLKKWMQYRITVSIWNSRYYGPESKIVSERTHEDAPDCTPKLKSAEAVSSTSIRVTWEPLPNTNCRNGILRGYKVSYRRSVGGISQITSADYNDNTKELRNLQKYTTYIITVAAFTVKDSKPSNAISRRTLQDAPSVPFIKEANVIPPQGDIRVPRVQITWNKPSNENGIITRYSLVYHYDNDLANQRQVNITDISSLVYTLNVLGQARFWFKMSASTIKEGPYTYIDSRWIPAYAPAIAPQGIRATKQSETTFTIAWQPLRRNEANGVITKYNVAWILRRIGRAKRTAVADSFTGTTRGNNFVLHSLRLCAQYEVRVAAATIAGSGPNATHNITTSQPGEPYNLKSIGIGKAFITLSWQKPKGMAEDVNNYQVYFKGSKSYWPTYSSPLDTKPQDGSQTTLKIDKLQPGTYYEFWVIASTVCGESNRSLTITVETKVDKPRKPQVEAPLKLKDSFNVTLWTFKPFNGPISLYQVIVIIGKKENFSEIPVKINDYQKATDNNEPFYITAELTPGQIKASEMFVIGDDKMYGIYKNVALRKGQVYNIAERAITKYKGESQVSDPVHIATIELTAESIKKAAKSDGNSATGVAIGVVISILIIVIILALLAFRYKRNRDAKTDDCSPMPLDDINDDDGNDVTTGSNNAAATGYGNDRKLYVNVDVIDPSEGVYEEEKDSGIKSMTKRQFLEYMKSLKVTDYSELKQEFKMLLNTHAFPVDIAKKPANKKKNRYANIVTYDHSRVVISRQADDENSDYVNASYIKGYNGNTKTYIATQGPTPQTVAEFWQMIWEVNSYTIVMLTNLKEGPKVKCHQYWPEDKEMHGEITVSIHKTEMFPDYVIRTLLLAKSNTSERRQVNHFQFTVWPDKGVPQYSTAVLGLRRQVNAVNPDHAGPLVIHCSAGVGRTGAYIVIDAMLERARHLKNVAISDYVASIRNDRPYMVQTEEQYVFIHLALYEVFTCGNTEIPAHKLQNAMKKLSDTNPQRNVTGYALEFERLNRVTEDYAKEDCDVGRSPENLKKNRYRGNIALNRSRVLLNKPGIEDVTISYINASHVDAYKERNAFLVTQAPLKETIEDFWIMVVNYDVRTIIMLNKLQEGNENFVQYWPESGSSSYGHVTVELLDTTTIGELISRHFNVTCDSATVQVQHIQMPNWKNKCCPTNSQSVLDLVNEVEQSQRHAHSSSSPMVVQCSNGIGRSGTFCAIYSIIERVKQEHMADVFQAVKRIRTNRPGAVETLDQYIYCYKIIQDYLDSFSDYANFTK